MFCVSLLVFILTHSSHTMVLIFSFMIDFKVLLMTKYVSVFHIAIFIYYSELSSRKLCTSGTRGKNIFTRTVYK